ncbi:MAG: hypothetical protein WAM91_05895 [Candidatus Acidiferrales bacterium]
MSKFRREFFRDVLALGVLQGLAVSPAAARGVAALFDQSTAQNVNPDFDSKAYDFWSGFLASSAEPVTQSAGQTRGRHGGAESDVQPVFLQYDNEGFKNAAEIDTTNLIPQGDVAVSLNTSTIKISAEDQSIFDRLQNAQLRVDVAQKTSIIPVIEALAYTVVSGMMSLRQEVNPKLPKPPYVQNVSGSSDAAWQKMQNIILPKGEGRWALNLEGQKKDSLFCKVLQSVVKQGGLFVPMIGLPGIAMSALQSFNVLYGAIHAEPVPIIQSNPLRVFATQEAVQKTGSPGSVTGIMLKSGTYVLVPAKQMPAADQFKNLTVIQGRVVPVKTPMADLDAAAAETLLGVTYVTFDVQVEPVTLFNSASPKTSV